MMNLRAALRPGAVGYVAAIGTYLFIYRNILANTFGEGVWLFLITMMATVIAWHFRIAGGTNRALYFWAGLSPLLGASLGYLAISLVFFARHGQFIGGYGLAQWLPIVMVMAGFMARAWMLSFLLIVWATLLYVMKPTR
jgi:hypothetical protein